MYGIKLLGWSLQAVWVAPALYLNWCLPLLPRLPSTRAPAGQQGWELQRSPRPRIGAPSCSQAGPCQVFWCNRVPDPCRAPHGQCASLGDLLSIWICAGEPTQPGEREVELGHPLRLLAEEPGLGLLHLEKLQLQMWSFFGISLYLSKPRSKFFPAENLGTFHLLK